MTLLRSVIPDFLAIQDRFVETKFHKSSLGKFFFVRYDTLKTTVNPYPNDYANGFLRFTPG